MYVTHFAYEMFQYNWDQIGTFGSGTSKYHLGFSFPCETPINTDMQNAVWYGDVNYRDMLSLASAGNHITQSPVKVVRAHYDKQNDSKLIYFPEGFINNFTTEHPHRLWASSKKLDGELLDSWREFLVNNYTEVEGQYGEINKVTTIKDTFLFYQDAAMGTASINDRSVVNDENGIALALGPGGILDDFGYISRNTGTTQKFSVVPTGAAVHHFDTLLKKWVRYSQGTSPISDLEGLHSTFRKYNGLLLKDDRLLNGVGITGVFDKVRNKVYMTFKSNVNIDGDDYSSETLSYNESIQGFDSFSSCVPGMWLEANGLLLATHPNNSTGWLQHEGDKNSFFGTLYPSIIELIIAPDGDIVKVFDTIEYKSEIYINDLDQSNLTLEEIEVTNDHQQSGAIPLIVDGNVRRKLRTWRMNIPRDLNSPNQDARMRNYFIKLKLSHTPNSNERLILHDIETSYRYSPH